MAPTMNNAPTGDDGETNAQYSGVADSPNTALAIA